MPPKIARHLLPLLAFCHTPLVYAQSEAWNRVEHTHELRWCADTSGGAPYVFLDPKDPSKTIGFEVDLMEGVAKRLNAQPKLVLGPWEQLIPMLLRDDCDVAVNGLEVTSERQKVIDFTIPYYYFAEQLTTRRGDDRFKSLADLHGRRVGTLAASLAQDMLKQDKSIIVVPYPSAVESYKDLELERLDAALFDEPISAWYAGPNPKLQNISPTIGESTYGMGLRKNSPVLCKQLDQTLLVMIKSGELEAIYRRWNLWTPGQERLSAAVAASDEQPRQFQKPWWSFIPLLLKGACITIGISITSMCMAVVFGFILCYGKMYGGSLPRFLCNSYIEIVRGTPLLIQLYLLYYGLPNLGVQLNAFVAAIIGMGMNYAAYEAEIYRAGLLSIPKGQTDAARCLGMTQHQNLWYIILPQAVPTILPPSTNDFIALFKDTSLVSVITVMELTKAYSQAATTTYRFLELGLVTAALYFLMSYPLSIWSKSLERKRHIHV